MHGSASIQLVFVVQWLPFVDSYKALRDVYIAGVGTREGLAVGSRVGSVVGSRVGRGVDVSVGSILGKLVGSRLGRAVGYG